VGAALVAAGVNPRFFGGTWERRRADRTPSGEIPVACVPGELGWLLQDRRRSRDAPEPGLPLTFMMPSGPTR
jgi:hypothetical protein